MRHRTGYFAIDTTKSDNKQREAETASTLRSAANSTMVYFDALVQPPTQPANPAKVLTIQLVPMGVIFRMVELPLSAT